MRDAIREAIQPAMRGVYGGETLAFPTTLLGDVVARYESHAGLVKNAAGDKVEVWQDQELRSERDRLWFGGTGSGDYVSIPDDAAANRLNASAWSIAAEATADALASASYYPVIIAKGDTGGGEWMVRMVSTTNKFIEIYAGGVRGQMLWPVDGLSHHVCYTYDGATLRGYIDGVEAVSQVVALSPTSSKDLRIANGDGAATRYWTGTVTDVALSVTTKWSEAEILALATEKTLPATATAHYNSVEWTDQVGSNDGTINGGPGYAAFDGSTWLRTRDLTAFGEAPFVGYDQALRECVQGNGLSGMQVVFGTAELQPSTIFAVARAPMNQAAGGYLFGGSTDTGPAVLNSGGNWAANVGGASGATVPVDTGWHLVTLQSVDGTSKLYIDGSLAESWAAGADDMDGLSLLSNFDGSVLGAWTVAFLAVLQGVDDEDRAKVESYLAAQYGPFGAFGFGEYAALASAVGTDGVEDFLAELSTVGVRDALVDALLLGDDYNVTGSQKRFLSGRKHNIPSTRRFGLTKSDSEESPVEVSVPLDRAVSACTVVIAHKASHDFSAVNYSDVVALRDITYDVPSLFRALRFTLPNGSGSPTLHGYFGASGIGANQTASLGLLNTADLQTMALRRNGSAWALALDGGAFAAQTALGYSGEFARLAFGRVPATVAAVLVFDRELTDTEYSDLDALLHQTVVGSQHRLVVEGDSLIAGGKDEWGYWLRSEGRWAGAINTFEELAVGGTYFDLTIGGGVSLSEPYQSGDPLAGLGPDADHSRVTYLLWAGHNDISSGRTAAVAYAGAEVMLAAAKAKGMRTVVLEVTPFRSVAENPAKLAELEALNALLKANTDVDQFVEIYQYLKQSYPAHYDNEAIWDADGIHPNDGGRQVIATYVASVVDPTA